MKKSLYILLAILCCYACRKDSEITTVTGPEHTPPVIIIEDYTPKVKKAASSPDGQGRNTPRIKENFPVLRLGVPATKSGKSLKIPQDFSFHLFKFFVGNDA